MEIKMDMKMEMKIEMKIMSSTIELDYYERCYA